MRSDSSRKFDAIKNFDLNLLIVFEMVYLHKSMTKAATKMQVTPSAISQSLQKLRTYFDDSLFIRENNLLRATLLANELHHQIEKKLEPFIDYVGHVVTSDTKTHYVIYCSNYYSWNVFPLLVNNIYENNENYSIQHVNQYGVEVTDDDILSKQYADIVLDINENHNPAYASEVVYHDSLIFICSKNHHLANGPVDSDSLQKEKYISISSNSLAARKIKNTIEMQHGKFTYQFSTPSLTTLFSVAENSSLLALVPFKAYEKFKSTYNLSAVAFKDEFIIPDITLYMTYKKKSLKNKAFSSIIKSIKGLL